MKKDPLPQARIDALKSEIKEEITVDMLSSKSPKFGSRKGQEMSHRPPSAISNGIDSDDDLERLDLETTTLKDLII